MFWARRRTAAWRLALPVILISALGSAVVMGVGYRLLSRSVRSRGDRWLMAEVRGVAEIVAAAPAHRLGEELERELAELEHHEDIAPVEAEDRSQSLFFLAVVGTAGRSPVNAARGNTGALDAVLSQGECQTDGVAWVHVAGWEYPVRVATTRLPGGGRVMAGATPFEDLELLEDIRDLAVGGWLAVFLGGVVVSLLSVRRVLVRVDTLADTASRMTMEDLGRRLPAVRNGDEIDRMAAAFNGLLERIDTGVRQIRAVADAVAHDLRSPLTALRAGLEMARAAESREALDRALDQAMADVDRLVSLVEASLDIAEAEAGALRAGRTELDLAVLGEGLVELYQPLAEEVGLQLSLEAPVPLRIEGDPALLGRALANLLDNVISHTCPGTQVVVRVYRADDDAVLEVRDTGPGFPKEIRGRAFERLVRGTRSEGRGLGLAVVRAVALAHGGRVELEQPPAGGSVVRLVLPYQRQ